MRYIFLFLILVGCTSGQVGSGDQVVPSPEAATPTPVPIPVLDKKPIVGWISEYDLFIKESAKQRKALLTIEDWRMTDFCPSWPKMSQDDRVQFWADLLYSITKPESNYDRTVMYWEEAQGVDEVTGLGVKTSEGLLQLSYSDVQTYRKMCKFDYEADKKMHVEDINSKPSRSHSWKSKFPDKTILDPYKNLGCGLVIADTMFDLNSWYNKNYPKQKSKTFDVLMGSYWSTMRSKNDTFQQVKSQMRLRKSKCY